MIDLIAGVALLAGSSLAVLAGIGLLRFPDVLARLHASSKAATIGVIATTFAAAVEADALGAAALLVLVIGLLFLSAPLGTSLLARAAAHSADAPPVRGMAGTAGSSPSRHEETAAVTDSSRRAAPAFLVVWLLVVWMALFSSATPGVVVGAVAVGALVTLALPDLRPRWPRGRLRPVALIRLTLHFAWSVVVANVDVALAVLRRRKLRQAIVRIDLSVESPTETALLMNAITFTPGTVALELHARELYLHVLDLDDERAFIARIAHLERLVVDAFGTRRERRAVGLGDSTGDAAR